MKVVFMVPPQVHLLDLSGAAHVFYEAREYGADIQLYYVGIEPNVVKVMSSSGIGFTEFSNFLELELVEGDLIFVPGLPMPLIQSKEFKESVGEILDWLKVQANKGVTIGSICTGAFLLGMAGLLDGKEATTHWRFIDVFRKQFLRVSTLKNRLFVNSGGIYTSAGVASGIDLALYILEERLGTKLATEVAREVVVYFRRGLEDPQLSIYLQYRNHIEDRIHEVQNWISQHLQEKIQIEHLAEIVFVSPRHLTRLFKNTTGITIGQYIEKMRLEKAVQLLQDRHKIAYIAQQCGFKNEDQLRQLLKKYLDKLPSEI